ncbi:MAG: ribosome-associated translation inhibitor RaiA [Nitrospirota bacterium]|nr:ribosome-associated translation inhibitor RaiA [Nitrospirota bacterium]
MRIPLQISVRNVALSEVAKDNIRDKAAQLDQYYNNITSCRVTVEAVNRSQRHGTIYNVRIDMTVPGSELVVNRESDEDVYVAIRDAFDAAMRQMEKYARKQRAEVKHHESAPEARVARLFSNEGYGFIDSPEGYEVYFHRNSVLNGDFAKLEVGTAVRFVEEMGEKGPQASTVTLIHHQAMV